MVTCRAVDAPPATPPASASPEEPPAYVYAAADIRPRQRREVELCLQASEFDWVYTGIAAAGVIGAEILNTQTLKQSNHVAVRMIGPALIGLTWGTFLSGGYLSLPKCDATWAYGPPPEGGIRKIWPVAAAITLLTTVTAPALDYVFLGPVKPEWTDTERSFRIFTAMGFGIAGSLLPYVISPKPWAATKEIQRMRVTPLAGGAFLSYSLTF